MPAEKKQRILLQIDTRDYYGRTLLRGIVHYAKLHTNWNFFCERYYYLKIRPNKSSFNKVKDWHADGIFLRETNDVEHILQLDTPTIICSDTISNPQHRKLIRDKPSILTDSLQIGQMGAEYFLKRGFRHFAFCGYRNVNWSLLRQTAFCQKLASVGHKDVLYCPTTRSWSKNRFIEYLGSWLKNTPRPLALMTCNDNLGLDVVDACKSAGILVPEEIAVLGVDNDEIICDMCTPTLSSIAMGIEKAGFDAAALLDRILSGDSAASQSKIMVLPKFVVSRQSSDTLAISDTYVADALNFIKQSTRRMIQVDDVVEHVCISRRNLEMRFKKTTGRSILFEIRRIRAEAIAQTLLQSNLPIHKIANIFNFNGPINISRFFKKQMGLSMQEYRQKHTIG